MYDQLDIQIHASICSTYPGAISNFYFSVKFVFFSSFVISLVLDCLHLALLFVLVSLDSG